MGEAAVSTEALNANGIGDAVAASLNGSAQDLALDLVPRLRKNVIARHQAFRGEPWWVLEHKETGHSYRLDPQRLRRRPDD